MKIFSSTQIKDLDRQTTEEEHISSAQLMERAAEQLFSYLQNKISKTKSIIVVAGNGNNGGDAFALARMLHKAKFKTEAYNIESQHRSSDCELNRRRAIEAGVPVKTIASIEDFPSILPNNIIIDGLLGTGLNRPPEGLMAQIIEQVNRSKAIVFAIDIPSGLSADKWQTEKKHSIIQATETITFQFPKYTFFLPEAAPFVGKWQTTDINLSQQGIANIDTLYHAITPDILSQFWKKRPVVAHKGTFGHALFIGGSRGKIGAAILASNACLRTGAGLLTTHIPACGEQIMPVTLPEAMTSIDKNRNIITSFPSTEKYTAVATGCGLGTNKKTTKALLKWLPRITCPTVLDADALNILAQQKNGLDLLPHNTIITPHPKEFDRIAGFSASHDERLKKACSIAKKNNIFVVLKNHHTAIACPNGNIYFNTTGNPGMATAGSGDVLTGMILSLLTQGYSPKEAAILGVFIHGAAGDAAACLLSETAMVASDIVRHIGKACFMLEKKQNI